MNQLSLLLLRAATKTLPFGALPRRRVRFYCSAATVASKRKIKPPSAKADNLHNQNSYGISAFATAEEYNLEGLAEALRDHGLYDVAPATAWYDGAAVRAVARYQVGAEPREAFLFREGSAVLWNMDELESSNLLEAIRPFEAASYGGRIVEGERESLRYELQQSSSSTSQVLPDGRVLLGQGLDSHLERFAISDALALSVKLGAWEALLERYILATDRVPEQLKSGGRIRLSRDDVLRRHGELLSLRHAVNLRSDLLDTPDFYWDRAPLEELYLRVCAHLSIAKRTRVVNEKLNHCAELMELLASRLSDAHHVRLEWMIIILIMVEVGFETIHYVERIL